MFALFNRLTNEMNQKDFDIKVYRLKDKLYRFALRLIQDSDEAIDLVQDTMMKLWKKRKELDNLQNIESYAIKITKNECFDLLKHRQVVRTREKEMGCTTHTCTLPKTEETEKLELVRKIINELPEIQRMVIQLRDLEEYETEEIKEITGLQENAIRTNLSRARKKVRDELSKIYSYGLERTRHNA